MGDLGRLLIGLGLLLVAAGAVVILVAKTGLPLGRLPGDFTFRGKHTTVYLPLGTCLAISVVLSLVLWAIGKWK